ITFLSAIDEKGRDLLHRWHQNGAHFIANSPASRSLIGSITGHPCVISDASVIPAFDPRFLASALRVSCVGLLLFFFALVCRGQQVLPGDPTQPVPPGMDANKTAEHEDKRLFGIIPNYRTSPSLEDYK